MSRWTCPCLPILTCSAGPTNSIRGAAFLTGMQDAIVADIGGTTTDIVALAPWVYPTDIAVGVSDTPIVIVHGDRDRIARSERSEQLARALSCETRVAFVSVAGGTHAMLGRRDAFDGLAARCAVWMLLGELLGATVQRINARESWLGV